MRRVLSVYGIETSGSVSYEVDAAMKRRSNGIDVVFGQTAPDFANEPFAPVVPENTGLHGHTLIPTPTGSVAIQDIAIGDKVIDASGKTATVRHVATRAAGKTALTLRAPYFGLDQDLTIGLSHGIKITSEVAEYMFGEDSVIVPAWALKDDIKVRHTELASTETLYSLQLSQSTELAFGSCEVESNGMRIRTETRVLNDAEARSFALECKEMRI